ADVLRRSYDLLGAAAVRAAAAAALAEEGVRDAAEVERRVAAVRQTVATAMVAVLVRHRYGIWYGDDELSGWTHRAAALFPADPPPPRRVASAVSGDDEEVLAEWCFEHAEAGGANGWDRATARGAVLAWLRAT